MRKEEMASKILKVPKPYFFYWFICPLGNAQPSYQTFIYPLLDVGCMLECSIRLSADLFITNCL